ncbi:MAG: rod shape-determining protein MreC [Syntrophaceae bacterium]|nr:rod shape-determining protein MreC [Syntrophaceae bacterium]
MSAPKRKKNLIILALFLLLTLAMISYHLRFPDRPGPVRIAVFEITGPVQSALTTSFHALQNAWTDYLHLIGLRQKNRELEKKNDELTNELTRYREGYLEAHRLQALFNMQQELKIPSVAARIIDKSQATLFKTVLLDKGTAAGVRTGQPVVSSKGVAGFVIEASPNVSKVLLITDEKSNIDALIQRTRAEGILQGDGSGGGRLKYLSNLEEVQAGDIVLTSGLSGRYPKGLVLGSVTAFDKKADSLFQKIEVIPATDFSRLEEVLVLVYKQKK